MESAASFSFACWRICLDLLLLRRDFSEDLVAVQLVLLDEPAVGAVGGARALLRPELSERAPATAIGAEEAEDSLPLPWPPAPTRLGARAEAPGWVPAVSAAALLRAERIRNLPLPRGIKELLWRGAVCPMITYASCFCSPSRWMQPRRASAAVCVMHRGVTQESLFQNQVHA